MINIYCLVDPRTNKPFYVGATVCNIHTRLSGHIHEAKHYWFNKNDKMQFICEILAAGRKPRIRLLIIADINTVDHYEHFFYSMFLLHGYTLLQIDTAFHYSVKTKTEIAKAVKYQQIKKYMQLCYKNILIIIW